MDVLYNESGNVGNAGKIRVRKGGFYFRGVFFLDFDGPACYYYVTRYIVTHNSWRYSYVRPGADD